MNGATATASIGGNFSVARFVLPAGAMPGRYRITILGTVTARSLIMSVTVLGSTANGRIVSYTRNGAGDHIIDIETRATTGGALQDNDFNFVAVEAQ